MNSDTIERLEAEIRVLRIAAADKVRIIWYETGNDPFKTSRLSIILSELEYQIGDLKQKAVQETILASSATKETYQTILAAGRDATLEELRERQLHEVLDAINESDAPTAIKKQERKAAYLKYCLDRLIGPII
jgi:hypothetical protein